MSAAYDDQNIFAKILRGEAALREALRGRRTRFAFMDIMPRGPRGTCW